MDFQVAFARSHGNGGHWATVYFRLQALKSYLNNNITGHSFNFHDFVEVPYTVKDYAANFTGKSNFLEDCLSWLNDEYYLLAHSSVCIAVDATGNGLSSYGYGFSSSFTIDGVPVKGSYVNANPTLIPKSEVELFSWHEPLHPWMDGGPLSDHASASFHYEHPSGDIVDITPMGAAYVHGQNGQNDTTWPNQHSKQDPTTFCGNIQEGQGSHSNSNNHDLNKLSSCTLNNAQTYFDTA